MKCVKVTYAQAIGIVIIAILAAVACWLVL